MELVEQLTNFNLTRQESAIYLCLLANGELTGYEVAKLTGISRSNTYNALAGLADKGAAYVMEGNVTKYTAVSFEEFSNNYIHKLTELQKSISTSLPDRREESDGYITIKGEQHIWDKLRNILLEAEYRVYIAVSFEMIKIIEEDLMYLLKKNIKVVILTNKPYQLDGAIIYQKDILDTQIRLIVDSYKVLTGEINDKEFSTCLYSKNHNLVDVFKEMLQNEITLIQLNQSSK
jgi:Predicted transcriptional regulators